MSIKKLTQLFIVSAVVVIFGFDAYVIYAGGTEASISWNIFEWAHKYQSIPFATGYVCGHLFWQMKGLKKLEVAKNE